MTGIDPNAKRAWLDETSYWTPKWLVPSAWHEHSPFAFWLINALRPRTIVELGTHNGFSFFVFCEALKRLGLSAEVNALDTWEGDEHAGRYDETVFESVTRISTEDYPDLAVMKRGYFDDFVEGTPDGSVDLLHIDGRHRLEDVWHDFNSWLPKVSDRGVIIFHDTTEHKKDFGVWQFWAEVSRSYPSFQFVHGHGLGVLAVGTEVPTAITEFLAAANADPDRVRSTYHELGGRVSEAAAVGRRLAAVTRERDQLRREVEDLRTSTSWRFTAPMRAVTGRMRRAPKS
ncbi:MAG: class I SAM-dependent methyltransferase [Leifsonia sp.]